jgi:beta-N-acetylhexosaminidase
MENSSNFTKEQIVGQRLMAGFDGTTFNDDLRYLIDALKVGGLVLFKRNIEGHEQIQTLCRKIMEFASACGQPPLFIAIDQEGGKVARLPAPFTRFPGNPFIKTPAEAEAFAHITAGELADVGINMNLAPVMDVAPVEIDSIMKDRAFGSNPVEVAKLGAVVIETLQTANIMAVAKHFPGIGRTTFDSHLDRPTFHADLAELQSFDLIPFQAAVSVNVSGIMLSHILYDAIDSQWPASLSVEIAKKMLRDRIGYNGLVMTDDLDMGSITRHYDIQTVVNRILCAEIDMALICHKGPDIGAAAKIIRYRMDDEIIREKTGQSLQRIMKCKHDYLGFVWK